MLAYKLNATEVMWDDYDGISRSPGDYVAWYESGDSGEVFGGIQIAELRFLSLALFRLDTDSSLMIDDGYTRKNVR